MLPSPGPVPPPERPLAARELGAVLLVSLLWALCFPLISSTVRYAPPLTLAALRASVAGLALLGYAALRPRPPPPRRHWAALGGVGLASTGLGFAGMYLAGGDVAPGLATVLANTQPLLAAAAGYFALGERLGRRHVFGLGLGFAGVLLTAAASFGSPDGQTLPRGVAFVMLGAGGVAAGNVLMKRIAPEVDPVSATGWQLVAGAAALAVAAALAPGGTGAVWDSRLWGLTALLAVPGTAVAFVLWFWLLRRLPLGRLNAFSYLTPVAGLAIGVAFYGERVGPAEVGGMGLVAAGLAAASLGEKRVRPSGPPGAAPPGAIGEGTERAPRDSARPERGRAGPAVGPSSPGRRAAPRSP